MKSVVKMPTIKTVKKWYHASPRRMTAGTILTGGHKPVNCADFYLDGVVYLSPTECPHNTILAQAIRDGYHVYEVEPLYPVEVGNWDDGITQAAKILRYVGNARGIAGRRVKKDRPATYTAVSTLTGAERVKSYRLLDIRKKR
jgi:hypothetical protein